jgi:hypothetical protein
MDEKTPTTPSSAAPTAKTSPPAKKRIRRKKGDPPGIIGRPRKNPAELLKVSTVRLTPSEWETYYALGGTDWLREKIRKDASRRGIGPYAKKT